MPNSLLASFAVAVTLVAALPAAAQGYDDRRDSRRDNRSEQDYDRHDDRVPYAGADLAYDYLTGEYYRYEGPRAQDPRAREQTGWRVGTLHTRPNSGYYAGVTWIGGHRYRRGCGCSARYSNRHGYNYDDNYEPYQRSNGYFERYASSNSHRWGYEDRHYWSGYGY